MDDELINYGITKLKKIARELKIVGYSKYRTNTKDELVKKIIDSKVDSKVGTHILKSSNNFDDFRLSIPVNNNNPNNETFGMTIEYTLCYINGITFPESIKKRVKLDLINSDLFFKLSLISLPIKEYVGSNNKQIDFILSNSRSLSVKTNNGSDKVCPQKIGQPTRKSFLSHFKDYLPLDSSLEDIKRVILTTPVPFIQEYLKHLFCCDELLWIFSDKGKFDVKLIKGLKEFEFENKFTFTRSLNDWKESTTIKYKGDSLGEFQIHSNRDNIKFRFHFKTLLKIISN